MAKHQALQSKARQILGDRGGSKAPGKDTPLTERELVANAAALSTTIEALGGREGILDTLAVASDDPQVDQLLRLIADPVYEALSIKQLCHYAGITVVDLFAAYRKAMVVRAHLLAYQTITQKLPAIVADVMERAAPYKIPCGACGAAGQVVDAAQENKLVMCPTCNGHKELLQLPDLDRQKVALELAQLITKSSGINIQQNQLTVPPVDPAHDFGGPGTLVEMQLALRELQAGPRTPLTSGPVIDVAPMPPIEEIPDAP